MLCSDNGAVGTSDDAELQVLAGEPLGVTLKLPNAIANHAASRRTSIVHQLPFKNILFG